MTFRCCGGSQRGELLVAGQAAVQREARDRRRRRRLDRVDRAVDLADAGEEDEDVAVVVVIRDEAGDALRQLEPRRCSGVGDVDRKRAAGAADDRGVAEELRDRLGFERGGHHDEHQVRPDGLAHLAEQRDGQVGVQAALVELVQHDAADAFEERVVEQLPREDALGHDVQARLGGDLSLEADLVADLAAELPAVLLGDALRRGRAATRRGWSSTRFGCSVDSRFCFTIAGGTRVVLPAPGSATSTSDRAGPRRCARISGMTGSIGSGVNIARPTMIAQTAENKKAPGLQSRGFRERSHSDCACYSARRRRTTSITPAPSSSVTEPGSGIGMYSTPRICVFVGAV